jgi:flagellar basal body-associated protein FliL
MNDTEIRSESGLKSKLVKIGIAAVVLLVVFLAGFIPMWMKANSEAASHLNTTKMLTRSEISNLIATAIVDARRGEYESARQKTSDFYTKLDAQIQSGESSAYSNVQNETLKSAFSNRDAIITLLAQRDPASVERLTDIYLTYRQSVGESVSKTSSQTNTNSTVNSQ